MPKTKATSGTGSRSGQDEPMEEDLEPFGAMEEDSEPFGAMEEDSEPFGGASPASPGELMRNTGPVSSTTDQER